MPEKLEQWLEFIRGCVRPFLVIFSSLTFFTLVIIAAVMWLDEDISKTLLNSFITLAVAIIGVWTGTRLTKTKI